MVKMWGETMQMETDEPRIELILKRNNMWRKLLLKRWIKENALMKK